MRCAHNHSSRSFCSIPYPLFWIADYSPYIEAGPNLDLCGFECFGFEVIGLALILVLIETA
jgi:hypothetical protein